MLPEALSAHRFLATLQEDPSLFMIKVTSKVVSHLQAYGTSHLRMAGRRRWSFVTELDVHVLAKVTILCRPFRKV